MRRLRGDAGSGSVLVLGVTVVVLAVGALQASLAAVAVARHRAAGVADLAALAGAGRVVEGEACAAARRAAAAGGGTLLSCTVVGAEVQVVVEVRPAGPLGGLGTARSRARAGPAKPAAGVSRITPPTRKSADPGALDQVRAEPRPADLEGDAP